MGKAKAETIIPSEPEPKPDTGATSISAQTEMLGENWPEVQPHAVAAMREEAGVEAEQIAAQEKSPETSAPSSAKKRGRPPGSRSKVSTLARKGATGNNPVSPEKVVVPVDYKVMGAQCAQLTFLVGTMVGGADFAPMARNPLTETSDQEMLTDAYAKYAEAKQMSDLPPGVALCATLMVYVASRLQFPNTQSRLQKMGVMFKNLWSKIRGRKNGARTDSGNNVVRQDDAKQEAGAAA